MGALFLGAGMIGFSICWGIAGLRNSKNWGRFFIFAVIGISAAQLAIGVVIEQNLALIDSAIYSQSGSTTGAEGSFVENVKHLQLVMFNECCAKASFTNEFFVPRGENPGSPTAYQVNGYMPFADDNTCPGWTGASQWSANAPTPPALWDHSPTSYPTKIPAPPVDPLWAWFDADQAMPFCLEGNPVPSRCYGFVKVCTALSRQNLCDMAKSTTRPRVCFNYNTTYRNYEYAVNSTRATMCNLLKTSTIDITGIKTPGKISIRLDGITDGVVILPIVGNNSAPTWGCGAGYGQVFQAAQLVWAKQSMKPLSTAMLAIGSIQIILAFMGIASGMAKVSGISTYTGTGKETTEQKYERYMREIEKDSSSKKPLASGKVHLEPHQNQFEYGNPNRMSTNSNFSKGGGFVGQQQAVAAYMDGGRSVPNSGAYQVHSTAFNVDEKI